MNKILAVLVDNFRTLSRLDQHPTHTLRVIHAESAVPVLQHERRTIPSLARAMSADTRIRTLTAIQTTFDLAFDLMTITRDDDRQIQAFAHTIASLDEGVRNGLTVLGAAYESDVSVAVRIASLTDNFGRLFLQSQEKKQDKKNQTAQSSKLK